jgi:ribosomal protein S18 acetylase RimI-like enzyme
MHEDDACATFRRKNNAFVKNQLPFFSHLRMTSNNYKQNILALDYCLFSNLTQSLEFRHDCTVALNPHNPDHQQSNLCFRVRLTKAQDLEQLIRETQPLFNRVSLVPRYFIDELCGPPLVKILQELKKMNITAEIDTDFIMSCTFDGILDKDREKQKLLTLALEKQVRIEQMQLSDLGDLVQVFAAAYKYGDDTHWLEKKLKTQLVNNDVYKIFGIRLNSTNDLVSAVILNTPPGLPDMGHINAMATDPQQQGKGFAAVVLKYALLGQSGTFYLEVYDDLYHAHRLYEKVGFKKEGTLKTISFCL